MRLGSRDRMIDLKEIDESGTVLVHLFVPGDGAIRFKGSELMQHVQNKFGRGVKAGSVKGMVTGSIACNPKQNTLNPQTRHGVTYMCITTDDIRAVTCPKCASSEAGMAKANEIERAESHASEEALKIIHAAEEAHRRSLQPVA